MITLKFNRQKTRSQVAVLRTLPPRTGCWPTLPGLSPVPSVAGDRACTAQHGRSLRTRALGAGVGQRSCPITQHFPGAFLRAGSPQSLRSMLPHSAFTDGHAHTHVLTCLAVATFTDLPGTPSREANSLDNGQDKLGSKDKEKRHEIEGTVGPGEGEEQPLQPPQPLSDDNPEEDVRQGQQKMKRSPRFKYQQHKHMYKLLHTCSH